MNTAQRIETAYDYITANGNQSMGATAEYLDDCGWEPRLIIKDMAQDGIVLGTRIDALGAIGCAVGQFRDERRRALVADRG